MTTQPLDIEIYRNSGRQAAFQVNADPANPKELMDILTGWLAAKKWDKGFWGEFELVAFAAGTWSRVGTVRAK